MNKQDVGFGTTQPHQVPSLMGAFDFTAEDLAANRNGAATERQLERLRVTQGQSQRIMVIVIGVMLAIIIFVVLFTPYGETLRSVVAQNPTVTAVGLGISAILYLLMLLGAFRASRRITSGKVSTTTGQVKLVGRPVTALDGLVYQRIKIGGQPLFITAEQAAVLATGTNYRVYFCGGGQMARVLSIEQA